MLKYCLKKWDKNYKKLEDAIRKDALINDASYNYLVNLVVIHILNDGEDVSNKSSMEIDTMLEEREEDDKYIWDNSRISAINDGSYQGTMLFLIPIKDDCPAANDYLMSYICYGSCSICDTLERIQNLFYLGSYPKFPVEQQVKDYMMLCKDIVCNIIRPYNYGWRKDEQFEQVEYDDK